MDENCEKDEKKRQTEKLEDKNDPKKKEKAKWGEKDKELRHVEL